MKSKLNRLTVLWFSLAALMITAAISIAAYTSLSSAKRVVTVKGTEQLFSSNILVPYSLDNELQTRIITFADNSDKKQFDVEIMNFIRGDNTKYDTNGINYELSIEIVDIAGNKITDESIYSQYKLNGSSLTVNPKVMQETLQGNAANKNVYNIEIPEEYLSLYKIKVTAVPEGSKYSSIGRIIASSTESYTSNWTGHYLETEEAAYKNGEELGIINYQISGQVEEDCVLSWDTSRVEIDSWFLQDMGISTSEITKSGNRKSVTLHLGADGTPDQYIITFYRTMSSKDVNDSWSVISNTTTGYITFKNSLTNN